ncbi:VWA domain-containing protein [Sulfurimonas sp. HSL1-6]|uniref:vWA domain-containing protein n=1 Tax=Thiomicrolovo immobilis TaxID=3131935 RepID=UPI0031F8B729
MGEWTLEYPWALGLIALFFLCEALCRAKTQQMLFPDTALLRTLSARSGWLTRGIKLLIFTLLALALASPIRQNEVVISDDKGYELSLVLDASGSMRQMDKFGIVKKIVLDFIDKREHDKLALTLFADFAYVAMPLTYDKQSLKQLLSKVDVGIAGMQRTALYEALFMSTKLFKSSDAKEKIAILLTDGIDNTSQVPLDVAIQSAVKHGIKVYVIGVGGRGDYNPEVLRKIARETGGKFYEAGSVERLQRIYDEIDTLEKSEIKADKYVKKRYYFQYPLGAALLLLVLYAAMRRRGHAL